MCNSSFGYPFKQAPSQYLPPSSQLEALDACSLLKRLRSQHFILLLFLAMKMIRIAKGLTIIVVLISITQTLIVSALSQRPRLDHGLKSLDESLISEWLKVEGKFLRIQLKREKKAYEIGVNVGKYLRAIKSKQRLLEPISITDKSQKLLLQMLQSNTQLRQRWYDDFLTTFGKEPKASFILNDELTPLTIQSFAEGVESIFGKQYFIGNEDGTVAVPLTSVRRDDLAFWKNFQAPLLEYLRGCKHCLCNMTSDLLKQINLDLEAPNKRTKEQYLEELYNLRWTRKQAAQKAGRAVGNLLKASKSTSSPLVIDLDLQALLKSAVAERIKLDNALNSNKKLPNIWALQYKREWGVDETTDDIFNKDLLTPLVYKLFREELEGIISFTPAQKLDDEGYWRYIWKKVDKLQRNTADVSKYEEKLRNANDYGRKVARGVGKKVGLIRSRFSETNTPGRKGLDKMKLLKLRDRWAQYLQELEKKNQAWISEFKEEYEGHPIPNFFQNKDLVITANRAFARSAEKHLGTGFFKTDENGNFIIPGPADDNFWKLE